MITCTILLVSCDHIFMKFSMIDVSCPVPQKFLRHCLQPHQCQPILAHSLILQCVNQEEKIIMDHSYIYFDKFFFLSLSLFQTSFGTKTYSLIKSINISKFHS